MDDRRETRLEAALTRIANGWGHCSTCGTPCGGYADCHCARPTWEPDDPVKVASDALAPPQTEETRGSAGE